MAGLRRAEADSLDPFGQDGVTCCCAKANKFRVNDADGVAWEMYTVLADAEPERPPARASDR